MALVHSSIFPFNHPTFIVYLLYSRSAVNASTGIVVCNVIHSSQQHFETEWKIIYYPYAEDEGSGDQRRGSLFLRLYSHEREWGLKERRRSWNFSSVSWHPRPCHTTAQECVGTKHMYKEIKYGGEIWDSHTSLTLRSNTRTS